MARKQKFQHQSLETPDTIAQYLKAIQEGFEKGEITFQADGGTIHLNPQKLVTFYVSASEKTDRVKIKMEISWNPQSEKDLLSRSLQIE